MIFRSHWIPKSLFATALLVVAWFSLRPKEFVEATLSEESAHTSQLVHEVIQHSPHFAAYVVLLIVGALMFQRRRNILILSMALVVLSLVFEGLQVWIPNRMPSVDDMIANVLGIIFGAIFSIYVLPMLAKRFKKPT